MSSSERRQCLTCVRFVSATKACLLGAVDAILAYHHNGIARKEWNIDTRQPVPNTLPNIT